MPRWIIRGRNTVKYTADIGSCCTKTCSINHPPTNGVRAICITVFTCEKKRSAQCREFCKVRGGAHLIPHNGLGCEPWGGAAKSTFFYWRNVWVDFDKFFFNILVFIWLKSKDLNVISDLIFLEQLFSWRCFSKI